MDETWGGREDWCSKKVWRSRNGMGNRVNADRWNIEMLPESTLGWTRLVPYRTVPHPYRGRTVGYARKSRDTNVALVLCARNNSRSVPRLVIYVGMGRCVRCCGTER